MQYDINSISDSTGKLTKVDAWIMRCGGINDITLQQNRY